MASCELCGRNPSVFDCEVEGTSMKVCQECSRFGKVKGRTNVRIVLVDNKKPAIQEKEYAFVQGYGMIVKNAREKKGLKQEDFAKSINEHKSLIHQVESENIKPNIMLAHKLEKALQIKIVEEIKHDADEESDKNKNLNIQHRNNTTKSSGMTLGDMFKTKK